MQKRSWWHKATWIALALLGGLAFFWLVVLRVLARLYGGEPCPFALARIVDNPIRRWYMCPLLDQVGVRPGERVLELGPGPGAFSLEAARRIEPGGSLVAVDIQPKMIAALADKVEAAGLHNVETHVAGAYELPLEDGSVDRAFLVTVLPEIPDTARALAELYRVLRPGGVLSISEEFLDPDYPLARTTIGWAEQAGFELTERHGNWFVYTLNFRKRDDARPSDHGRRLLEQAAPLLRLPHSPQQPPEVLPDGSGLRCPVSGVFYPYHDGVLDLMGQGPDKTVTQQALDTRLSAWLYDRFRGWLTRALSSPDLAVEVAHIQQRLQAQPGDVVLDLACGHGVFTIEWAKRVGPEGLVLGLDLSPAMLARAAEHVRRWGLDNVLLVRGDAHHLPFADGVLTKINCSGGFHQFPDLPQALGEITRVSAGGAALTASTFAQGPEDRLARLKRWLKRRFELHFVPLVELGQQLSALGYADYSWWLPGPWFGYTSARKREKTEEQ